MMGCCSATTAVYTMPNTPRNLQSVNLPSEWTPSSWRAYPALQLPQYPDAEALEEALVELRTNRRKWGVARGQCQAELANHPRLLPLHQLRPSDCHGW